MVQRVFILLVAVIWLLPAGGCEPYRVEYHTRPGFYSAAVHEPEQRVTLEDGTVLVFRDRNPTRELDHTVDPDAPRFEIRKELEDGAIVLRALLPQDVLANTLTCLRNREYELIWEQLLATQTRAAYELRGQGYDEFAAFFDANRMEMAATLTRMLLGLVRGESFMANEGDGVIRFWFHPRIATDFQFKTAEVISEDEGLRLLMIR